MNRVKDYARFVGWFAGLGYMMLWPFTVADVDGPPFGAAVFCRDALLSLPDSLCNSAHTLQLPPGLHALGFLSAVFVTARLLLHAFRCTRRRAAATLSAARVLAVLPLQKSPPRRPRLVKPRSHFGLRGVPH